MAEEYEDGKSNINKVAPAKKFTDALTNVCALVLFIEPTMRISEAMLLLYHSSIYTIFNFV